MNRRDSITAARMLHRGVSICVATALAMCSASPAAALPPITSAPVVDEARARLLLDEIPDRPALPAAAAAAASQPTRVVLRALAAAQSRYDEDSWTECIAEADKALQADPANVEAHLLAARAAAQQGNAVLAASHLDEAASHAPRDPRVHQLRGRRAWQDADFSAAIRHLRLSLMCAAAPSAESAAGSQPAFDPVLTLTQLYLGLSLAEEGYAAAARDQLQAYLAAIAAAGDLSAAPRDVRTAAVLFADKVQGRLADIHEQLGESAQAAESIELAVQSNPTDLGLRQRLIRLLARAGRRDEALAQARQAARTADDETAVRVLEEACTLLGDPQQVVDELALLSRTSNRTGLTIKLAERYVAAGRRDEGVKLLSAAAASAPADIELRLALAAGYRDAGRWKEMLAEVIGAVAALPREGERALALLTSAAADADARRALLAALPAPPEGAAALAARTLAAARLLRMDGRGDEADQLVDETFDRLEAARDVDPALLGPLGAAVARRGLARFRWEFVEKLCQRLIDRGCRDGDIQLALAESLDSQDEFARAEAAYRSAAELRRKDPTPLLKLARMLDRRGDGPTMRGVLQAFQSVLADVDPRCTAAHEGLVRIMLAARQAGAARKQIEEMKRLKLVGPAVERAEALVELTTRRDKGPDLLVTYRGVLARILREHPDDVDTLLDLGRAAADLHDYAGAGEALDRLAKLDPGHLAARELKFTVLRAALRQDEAQSLMSKMLRERPRCGRWRRSAAEIALDRVDDEAALTHLKWLAEQADGAGAKAFARSQMLQLFSAAGRADEAIALARLIYDESPADDGHRELLIRGLEWNGRNAEAVEITRDWHEGEPNRTEMRAYYLNRLVNAGQHCRAVQEALTWYESAPDNQTALLLLTEVLLLTGDAEQAISLAQASRGGPAANDLLSILLNSYIEADRHDDALDLLRSAASDPSAGDLDRLTLEVYLRSDRLGDAERLLNRLIEPFVERRRAGQPWDVGPYVSRMQQLSMVNERQGKQARSEELLQEVFSLAPDDAGINNDLGYLWADRGRNLTAAEELVRWAVAQEPRQASYLDSLGWVRYKRGEFKDAVRWLQRARRWSIWNGLVPATRGLLQGAPEPIDPVIADHLGDSLWRLGRKDEAVASWKETVAAVAARKGQSIDSRREQVWSAAAQTKIDAASRGEEPTVAASGETAPPEIESRAALKAKLVRGMRLERAPESPRGR